MKAFAKITAIILVVVGILVIVGGFVAAVSLMVSHGIALRGDLDLPMGRIQRAVPMMSGVGTGLVSFLAGLVLTAMVRSCTSWLRLRNGRIIITR